MPADSGNEPPHILAGVIPCLRQSRFDQTGLPERGMVFIA
jgi:hypothetical protein